MFLNRFLFYPDLSGVSFVQIQTSSLLFTVISRHLSSSGILHNRSLLKNHKLYLIH